MKNLNGVLVLLGLMALAVNGFLLWFLSKGEATTDDESDPPLAALMYLWFGFDLKTGESVGGLRSSHWNLDVGTHGSRVGVTDEPEYGFYSSDDPDIIAGQLADMEEAGINVIIASWQGNGVDMIDGAGCDSDARCDPEHPECDPEKAANHRALLALLEYIATTEAPFKVVVLVEPYMKNPGGLERVQRRNILSFLRDEVYNVYPDQMFRWEGNPLLVTWCEVDLADPNQARFTIKRWCSTKEPEWKDHPGLDWN